MPDNYRVKDYMRTDLVTLRPEMDISKAIEMFVENKVSGAPVIDEQHMLIGMLSEADCIDTYLSCAYNTSAGGCGTVSERMSTSLTTLDPDVDLIAAARVFIDKHLRRIPVVENQKLIGIITRHNLLKAIHDNGWTS